MEIAKNARRSNVAMVLQPPERLGKGITFRLVFLTKELFLPISPKASDYDLFVNQEAHNAIYNGKVVKWKAIISTLAVNAIDHIGKHSVGVFLVNGTEVAKSTTTKKGGLWSGSIKNPITLGIDGNSPAVATTGVWTGTAPTGERANSGQNNGALGTDDWGFGSKASNDKGWVQGGFYHSPFQFQLYAISDILIVV